MKKRFRIIKFKKNKPVLQIKALSKSFQGRPVLKKISLDLYSGEIVGLLGPNGCGKTSLYGCVLGRYKVDSGKIFLNQKDITSLPIHERAKLGIGYLSQYRSVFSMSTYDNLLAVVQLTIQKSEKQKSGSHNSHSIGMAANDDHNKQITENKELKNIQVENVAGKTLTKN